MSCAQSRFCSERCGPDSGKTDTVIQGGSLKSFQKNSLLKRKESQSLRDSPHAYVSHSARLWWRATCPSWASCAASRSSRRPWWGLIMSSAAWKKGPCCLWTSTGWTSPPPTLRTPRKVPALYFYLSFLMKLENAFCFLPSFCFFSLMEFLIAHY